MQLIKINMNALLLFYVRANEENASGEQSKSKATRTSRRHARRGSGGVRWGPSAATALSWSKEVAEKWIINRVTLCTSREESQAE